MPNIEAAAATKRIATTMLEGIRVTRIRHHRLITAGGRA
ncbi:unnamed protein product, partial [Ectocarpus fasciculatus]